MCWQKKPQKNKTKKKPKTDSLTAIFGQLHYFIDEKREAKGNFALFKVTKLASGPARSQTCSYWGI